MKLLNKALDKAIELSKPVKELTAALTECAEQMKKVATTMATIAYNQGVHHQMIMKMWNVQSILLAKMKEGSLDTKMPDIKSEDAKPSKPN